MQTTRTSRQLNLVFLIHYYRFKERISIIATKLINCRSLNINNVGERERERERERENKFSC